MFKKIVINVTDHETRMAFLEEGKLAEIVVERKDVADIVGNIYKGRVQRVLPGMQSAFIDIGMSQAAFIYVDDVSGYTDQDLERLFGDPEEDPDLLEPLELEPGFDKEKGEVNIEDLISEGQEIMVQIDKTPMGTKGARVTSYISLPGRFLVFMPKSSHIGISKRIVDEKERSRLKELISGLRQDEYGYIVRTAGEGVLEKKFADEMKFLKTLWENIQRKFKMSPAPSLLHKELVISLRAVRDLLTHEAEKLIIDSPSSYQDILVFLDTFMPGLKGSVELYEGVEPIFDVYALEAEISRALKKKVWLKSGGSIVIEQTEALVAIDVNTGRYVGNDNPEETILKTNLEAAREIAHQIRLRDIGGLIIVDFIDMEKTTNQEKIFTALQEAFKKDRSKTHILPMSEMGLIQMTRKRTRKPLNRLLCEPCFYCGGEGHLMSRQTVCYDIYREVVHPARTLGGGKIAIRVNPAVAELLHGEEHHLLLSMERRTGREIVVCPDHRRHQEQFDISEIVSD